MKKLLAIVLASVMVLACGAVLFVSAGEPENVAPNATYTLHEQFRMGGADVGWGWDANAAISYPDENGNGLTDGLFAESTSYGDAAWIGLNQTHPDFAKQPKPLYVDFTLAEETLVGTIKVHLNNLCDAGISAPVAVTALSSDDGENYGNEVFGEYTEELAAEQPCVSELHLDQQTKYVRICFYSVAAANAAAEAGEPAWLAALANPSKSDSWTFIDEIEIFNDGVKKESAALWITHYDPDANLEGAGIIWTGADGGDGWCHHAAFEPVEGKKTVFKLVELSPSNSGTGKALSVPEGGFVYTINTGNDWPALMQGKTGDGSSGAWYDDPAHLTMPKYDTENVYQTWELIPTLEVGETYTIEGIDLEGKTLPTSTPDMNYWDPEYVCTATITKGDWEKASEKTEYNITADGNLDDADWADDAWTTAKPGENAGWQSSAYAPSEGSKELSYDYQYKVDDNYFYVAVRTNYELTKGAGNGASSFFRIWLKANLAEDASSYTHFFDCYVKEDDTIGKRAAVNTSATENKPINNDGTEQEKDSVKYQLPGTAYEAGMVATEDGFTAEMKIPLSEINSNAKGEAYQETFEKFFLYITVSTEKGNAEQDQCLFTPPLGVVDDTVKHITTFWNAANNNEGFEILLDTGDDNPTPPAEDDTYKADIEAKVGDPIDEPKFNTEITSEVKDGQAIFTLKLSGFKAEDQISSLIFPVFYDDERLTPAMTPAKDGSLPVLSGLPGEGGDAEVWENMTVLYEKDDDSQTNVYPGQAHVYVQVGNPNDETKLLDENSEITITLTFDLNPDFDKAGIWMESRETVCSSWDFEDFYGEAKAAVAEVPNDNPTPPDEPTPPDQPSEPGDAGILVFAILGILAIAGAAVVIKVRK